LTVREQLQSKYEDLLKLAKQLDDCFEIKSGGWGSRDLKADKVDEYWKTRDKLETITADWMADIRKVINGIPASIRKSMREERTDPETGDTYSIVIFENKDFGSLMGFFEKITSVVEVGYNSVLHSLVRSEPVYQRFRSIRGQVLSLCGSIELFSPEIMVTIDQQVDLIFKLRENGMPDIALLLEEIDQIDDNVKKCLNSRTALEKRIQYYLETKRIEITQGFYTNLDNAINAGLTDKSKRNAIGAHYSFVSKIIHGELEANMRNTQFAVNGVLNILNSFF